MTNSGISDFELEVIQAAMDGKTANFLDRKDSLGNSIRVVIQGKVVRNLLLGLPLPIRANDPTAPTTHYQIPSTGVRVRGAYIEGGIDISDSSGHDGNGCFPLLLEDCVLTGNGNYNDPAERPEPALDAKHTRILRLMLNNCQAGFIDLTDAEILGDLDLEGLHPLCEGGQCRVEARGVRIDGSIKAPKAKLNLKQIKLDKPEATLADYALNLPGAEITGSVLLRPEFIADGGVNISNAHIQGDFWADGAHLIAQGNHALRGQSARVEGIVGLTCLYIRSPVFDPEKLKTQTYYPERFYADGAISFIGAYLGTIMLMGAVLRRKSGERDNWFACSLAEIKQKVELSQWQYLDEQGYPAFLSFEADYGVWFEGARLSGGLNAIGAKFNTRADEAALSCTNLEISGDLRLDAAEAGVVSLQGAKLNSDLFINQTRFLSLTAQDINVKGSVYWWGELSGTGNFRGACINGELFIGADASNPLHLVNGEVNVIFEDANVTRDLKIKGVRASQINPLDWTKYLSVRVRVKKLACYENWQLCEAMFEPQADDTRGFAVISFLMDVSNGSLRFLDGLSTTIFNFNNRAGLRLESEAQASDYLKFFCAHVWSDLGAFRIVESTAETSEFTQTPIPLTKEINSVIINRNTSDNTWKAEVFMLFAQMLFKTSLLIHPNGVVEMLSDKPIADLDGDPIVTYIAPVRIIRGILLEPTVNLEKKDTANSASGPRWAIPSAIDSSDSWVELSEKEVKELRDKIIGLVEFRATPLITPVDPKPLINLKGLKVGSLDDNHGMNWGDGLMLNLEGFEYARFEATETSALKVININDFFTKRKKDRAKKGLKKIAYKVRIPLEVVKMKMVRPIPVWRHRLEWLNKQYNKVSPKRTEYKPQPYEQLARVFRSDGNQGFALQILIEKLRLERRLLSRFSLTRLGLWLLDHLFGYGLLWLPVFRTFILCWLIGWAGVELANQGHLNWPPVGFHNKSAGAFLTIPQPVLVVDAVPVSTLALTDDIEEEVNTSLARESVTSSPSGRFVKEIRCGDQIEPALYALDVFVPLLDLKQESKCTISAERGVWRWRVAKSAYALLGWIVTSALILTISGVIRRQVER